MGGGGVAFSIILKLSGCVKNDCVVTNLMEMKGAHLHLTHAEQEYGLLSK